MLKTANPTLRSHKKIAIFSMHEANLLPMATYNQLHDLSVSTPPKFQLDWPLDQLQFEENFPLRQLSMKGKFLP